MKQLLAIGLSIAWLAVAESYAQEASSQAAEIPSQKDDEAAIRAGIEAYVQAFNARDAKAVAAFWSPDAVYTSRANGQQVVGREAIAEQFEFLFDKLAVNGSRSFALKHAPQVRVDRPRPTAAADETELHIAADLAD